MATRKKKETAASAKVTKAATLRTKDVAGLQAEIKDLQKAHFGLRMQKATQQLDFTDQSVKSIAMSMGFDDPYYFSKRFRKIIGMSPKKYRMTRKD